MIALTTFEPARVFVRLDHVARFIVNVNHMVKPFVGSLDHRRFVK
jgi:hypothetical protein